MTIEELCKEFDISEIGDFSDGYHTFNDLYYQRAVLFAAIVNQNKDISWKSYRHENGELCFGGGWFIVGIDTPKGSYTYHYNNKYWNLFECEELILSKHWDGHTDKDVERLLTLSDIKKSMTINEYQQEALRTEPKDRMTKTDRMLNGLMGLNCEAGEAIDILKKHLLQGHELNKQHLAKELGDIAWYLAVSADAIGYSLEDIFRMNVEKLRARYSEGFDVQASINRNKNDI